MPIKFLNSKLLFTSNSKLGLHNDCCCGGGTGVCINCNPGTSLLYIDVDIGDLFANYCGYDSLNNVTYQLSRAPSWEPSDCVYGVEFDDVDSCNDYTIRFVFHFLNAIGNFYILIYGSGVASKFDFEVSPTFSLPMDCRIEHIEAIFDSATHSPATAHHESNLFAGYPVVDSVFATASNI
jgi:hypothetical protein